TQLRTVRAAIRDSGHDSALSVAADHYESALKQAAADFAHAVQPQDGLTPAEYLDRWRAANEHDAPDYMAFRKQLKEAVDAALEPFIAETIARWEGNLAKTGNLTAF